jgi:FkbM family methyltransferase
MSFVSYAQNFEDVMLWRALKHIERGSYVDIGAQDPVTDSVSFAFYEGGWRGCHVEPTMQYSMKLRQARPDELVLQAAIGKDEGLLSFFEFENTGLSTSDPAIANEHRKLGFEYRETTVPVISLQSLLDQFTGRDVHWMKIDVEGAEHEVIAGWKESPVRPWVLVIESTRPLTQEVSYASWEQDVLSKGYEFVYFDGLNRFYVSEAHPELKSSFLAPPNIFDGFVLSGTASQPFYARLQQRVSDQEQRALAAEANAAAAAVRADCAEAQRQQEEARSQHLEMRCQQVKTRSQQLEARCLQLETESQRAEAQMQRALETAKDWEQRAQVLADRVTAVHASSSWRITAPMRAVKRVATGDFSLGRRAAGLVAKGVRATIRPYAVLLARAVLDRPALRHRISNALRKFPTLREHLALFVRKAGLLPGAPASDGLMGGGAFAEWNLSNMTPSARKIYAELKDAIQQRKELH